MIVTTFKNLKLMTSKQIFFVKCDLALFVQFKNSEKNHRGGLLSITLLRVCFYGFEIVQMPPNCANSLIFKILKWFWGLIASEIYSYNFIAFFSNATWEIFRILRAAVSKEHPWITTFEPLRQKIIHPLRRGLKKWQTEFLKIFK